MQQMIHSIPVDAHLGSALDFPGSVPVEGAQLRVYALAAGCCRTGQASVLC